MTAGFQLDRRFAQTLVDSIAAELNKNVNITNDKGIIIASFSKERIGQTHEAAARMLTGGCPKEFAVSLEDVMRLGGVREGYNVPIQYAGRCIGVIGVTGKAEEAAPYARLAARFVDAAIEANNRQEQLARMFQERRSLQSALLSKLIMIQEEERKKISRELHDEIGQMLTSTLLSLRMLSEKTDNGDLRHCIAEIRDLTATTLDTVRNLAVELRPMMLEDLGLSAAIRRYVSRFVKQYSICTEVFMEEFGNTRLAPEMELSLYRIIQEALTNAAKHSAASHIKIEVKKQEGQLLLLICDNGVGFNRRAHSSHGERLGLFGMQERVTLMGGRLSIKSELGQGTSISVVVPLQ